MKDNRKIASILGIISGLLLLTALFLEELFL
nr:MAG TPA: hypothetical protein [Caudoviricetes sp.]